MYLNTIDAQQQPSTGGHPSNSLELLNNAAETSGSSAIPNQPQFSMPRSMPQTLQHPNHPPSPKARPFNAERLLCASAGVFLLTLHTGPRMRSLKMFTSPFSIVRQIFRDLASASPSTLADQTRGERELILWASFVLGTNAAALGQTFDEVKEVVRIYYFGDGAEGPKSTVWEDVKAVLERVFWIEMKSNEWKSWWESNVVNI